MNNPSPSYIPALKYHWLTRFYDTAVRLTTREKIFKKVLVNQIEPSAGEKLLDIGCGTGTLIQMLAIKQSELLITGLDADTEALNQAEAKIISLVNRITLEHSFAQQTPFDSDYFDIAVSSLFFHHLTSEQKLQTLKETLRVLKPEGRFYIADWGEPSSFIQRLLFYFVQILDGFETTSDNVEGALPGMMQASGFIETEETANIATPLGTIRLIRAIKPAL